MENGNSGLAENIKLKKSANGLEKRSIEWAKKQFCIRNSSSLFWNWNSSVEKMKIFNFNVSKWKFLFIFFSSLVFLLCHFRQEIIQYTVYMSFRRLLEKIYEMKKNSFPDFWPFLLSLSERFVFLLQGFDFITLFFVCLRGIMGNCVTKVLSKQLCDDNTNVLQD